jgi:hypothetical protein
MSPRRIFVGRSRDFFFILITLRIHLSPYDFLPNRKSIFFAGNNKTCRARRLKTAPASRSLGKTNLTGNRIAKNVTWRFYIYSAPERLPPPFIFMLFAQRETGKPRERAGKRPSIRHG